MKRLMVIAGCVALTGCAGYDEVYRSYHSEAGALVDNGGFGTANRANHQAMTGARSVAIDLSNRFAQEVPSTVTFAFDSARLDAAARDALRQQAHWIRQFPEVRFRVYGHTDAVGTAAYNQRLGLRRARAAVQFLASQGIDRARLEAVASFGETQPLIVTEGRERRNRRTVTEVSGFVASSPIVMDGKYAELVHRDYLRSAAPRSTLITIGNSGTTGTD